MESSGGLEMTMQWIEARVAYTPAGETLRAELVAALFYDMGLHGVLLEETDEASGKPGMQTTVGSDAVIGYIPATAGGWERCETLRQRLRQLPFATRLETRLIDDRDWAQHWKSHFKPLKVAPGLIVAPSWEKKTAKGEETVIEIDPGMAFGTGHHPTTVLCLRLIRQYLKTGDLLLDVGTGTGILAICAVKSGSGRAVAIDSDETAIGVARENRRRNRIAPGRMPLLCGDLTEPLKGRFNAVVANILPHVIVELVGQLDRVIKPGGLFIASGIPDEKADAVVRKIQNRSMQIIAAQSLDGWTAFACRCLL